MKIKDYPLAGRISKTDVLLVDGNQGTRTMDVETSPYKLFNHIPEMHNQIWRGKNLGSSYSTAQKTAIRNGSFDDLWVGDYWFIGGNTWRIMHFGYPLHTNEVNNPSMMTPNTALIMPDHPLLEDQMNLSVSDIRAKGAVDSYGYTTVLPRMYTTASNAFGAGNLITFRETLPASVSETTNLEEVAYRGGNIGLPSYGMFIGGHHPSTRGYSSGSTQLAAFALNPQKSVTSVQTIWTSDLLRSGDVWSNGRMTPQLKPVIYTPYTSSSYFRPFVVLG